MTSTLKHQLIFTFEHHNLSFNAILFFEGGRGKQSQRNPLGEQSSYDRPEGLGGNRPQARRGNLHSAGGAGPSAQVVSTYLKNSKQLSTLDIHLGIVLVGVSQLKCCKRKMRIILLMILY